MLRRLGTKSHTLDMTKIVLTKTLSCFYCNLLWTLTTTSLRPLKKTPYRQFCLFCALEVFRPLMYKPSRPPIPWFWPRISVLISEAWCCHCLGGLCKFGFRLSDCPTGIVRVYCYSDRHRICEKCGLDVISELTTFHTIRWICDCFPTVNNE